MIAPEFIPIWGGTGSYVVELLKNLPKDVDVHVVTLRRAISEMSENDLTQNDPQHVFNRNIDIHYISNAKETFFYNLAFQVACFRKIPELHKKHRFDVLHSQFGHMSDVFLQLLKKVGIPNVATVHGTTAILKEVSSKCGANFSDLEWSEKQSRLFYPVLKTMESLYAKHISKFIAVSNVTRTRIIKDLGVEPRRVCTVYNGVDTELFHMPSKSEIDKRFERPTIVYMGRIMAKKGMHVLIKAIPKILSGKPQTHFMFVGGGHLSFFREMIRKMGIPEKNFSFVGHVGYHERTRILREATVFVNPSFFELCSISILEAMSSGAAVVASDVGGNPELIKSGKNGILVPAFRTQGLSEAIISLLENETLNGRLGIEARKTVEELFSARKMGEETWKVYRQLLM
jgi:glycosyltransferase involved in cell wall biosynthesis